MPSELQVHSRTAGYAPFHALALRRSEFRARRPPKAGEGKHENENGRSGSAVPSPQRNVNEIRSVQNTNHAPATNFNGLHQDAPDGRVGPPLLAVHAPMIASCPPLPIDPLPPVPSNRFSAVQRPSGEDWAA